MNKSDRLKDAQKLDDYGVDPDKIMVTYTLEEYAASVEDEVDTFDEDTENIKSLIAECQYHSDKIDELKIEIEETEASLSSARTWSEKYDLQQDLRYANKKLQEHKMQLEKLVGDLAEARESFKNKYAR